MDQGNAMPLNPLLYELLQERLGDVTIVNEGQRAIGNYIRDPLTNRLKFQMREKGEHYRVNCPYCTDMRKRLYFNYQFGLYDEQLDSYNYHLAYCFNEDCLRLQEGAVDDLKEKIFGHLNARAKREIKTIEGLPSKTFIEVKAEWPGPVKRLHELPFDHHANAYLRMRGYDTDELGKYLDICYCSEADDRFRLAANRIIIPIYKDNVLRGWQARYIGERNWKSCPFPKYYTMPGTPINKVLYNYDDAKQFKVVVVCEGPSDVWAVGPQGVALFNYHFKPLQQRLLEQTWLNGIVVLMLDPEEDAQAHSDQIYEDLRKVIRGGVINVKLPEGRDPGNSDREYIWAIIKATARKQGIKIDEEVRYAPA